MDHKLTAKEIHEIKSGRAFLVDVRSEEELAEQSCPIAIHWDVRQMSQGRFPKIPREKPVFVFCRAGNRSSIAQSMLLAHGFTDVRNLGGIHNLPDELCA